MKIKITLSELEAERLLWFLEQAGDGGMPVEKERCRAALAHKLSVARKGLTRKTKQG